ncbi:uncharacterized protein BDR25DRAFT_356009 [Lindgomyces ingoldianus]|uniref:Uncharacterized protein n=1 Tax=Lindgomyces ingoldianus TaxID=673940 RepID=A0ACB6QS79_9PLEO|nr:uncharacterized protein BDR25DRAFT_356009 [Lindgomyces ingoldianus]KAF2469751.1 hypothetical protein BDR25DRAFT_356009 [Lindgomyces ingoldianus]
MNQPTKEELEVIYEGQECHDFLFWVDDVRLLPYPLGINLFEHLQRTLNWQSLLGAYPKEFSARLWDMIMEYAKQRRRDIEFLSLHLIATSVGCSGTRLNIFEPVETIEKEASRIENLLLVFGEEHIDFPATYPDLCGTLYPFLDSHHEFLRLLKPNPSLPLAPVAPRTEIVPALWEETFKYHAMQSINQSAHASMVQVLADKNTEYTHLLSHAHPRLIPRMSLHSSQSTFTV